MTTDTPADLEKVIRQSGEGWLIDWYKPRSEAIDNIRRTLAEVDRRAKARLGGDTSDLTELALLEEYKRNPLRVKGFFQILGSSCTPDILVMAWRLIQGMEIKKIDLEYQRQTSFQMRIILESPCGAEDHPYISSDVNDSKIFRHIGIMKIETAPVFDGFYPLRVRE